MRRRDALRSMGALFAAAGLSKVGAVELRSVPHETALSKEMLPSPVMSGGQGNVFKGQARATLTAVFDRLIPHDELGASASEAGCVDFLDAQMNGPYGESKDLYLDRPLRADESELMGLTISLRTRRDYMLAGLEFLDSHARKQHSRAFAELAGEQMDTILVAMEEGHLDWEGAGSGSRLFEFLLMSVREGYFADPLYGGNRNMVGWKLVGFPGARYDYRQYIDRRGQNLGLEPISLIPVN
ncbi:gluconate 2-dehydrogenase subunit 3 family protein [Pseudomonas sichuanensis]|uniref:gluconate 2-dehydrogenase subunit 3 family protein n=1 Tax=Pseudomonas sichuanensis TaxID=2213015 RepID=UPI00244B8FCE|nr:gluconate 2-dehydrogenase subunit 3 family protein [Pseudomonas sichuanensis]MDH0730190.1 gluconate 2-dehydrogenase subunit 3 family protein [Pseudomonas sichuanensis]MDH1581226.1 gluconate 2-dehydrogenase subunit 3 family protein [Pseudomonas sichuanensis]MDH1593387.1 gluconate 2-dehydrogenase subunit 3 family protein [Pseudomonas sichuanensis]MDH1597142.1 gluconate 2-dehydrogenase subunit 3 family protein [Pseudomonas sichuanensis]